MNNNDDTLSLFDVPARARTCRPKLGGRAVAEHAGDPGWLVGALSGIEALARTGREFQAHDLVRELGVSEPDKPCRWGAVFSAAHRAGTIRKVGATQSSRRTVNRSLTCVWVGADDLLPDATGDRL